MAQSSREAPPAGPLLLGRGGGGGLTSWRQAYWIDLELTTATVSADVLRDAGGRAKELWPAEDLPEWPRTAEGPNETRCQGRSKTRVLLS